MGFLYKGRYTVQLMSIQLGTGFAFAISGSILLLLTH